MKVCIQLVNCVIFLLFFATKTAQGFVCPNESETSIAPCSCIFNVYGAEVDCQGPEINVEILSRTFQNLRTANSLNSNDTLEFHQFTLSRSSLEQLDLTPFSRIKVKVLELLYNYNLTSITGPLQNGNENASEPLLEVGLFSVYYSSLTDSGLGDSLKYFASTMIQLEISNSKIQGSQRDEDGDFLPGLSRFVNLQTLDLQGNEIREIRNGAFRKNSNLLSLHLSNNKFEILGEDAFLFDDPPEGSPILKQLLYMDLTFAGLKEGAMGRNGTSLAGNKRPFYLDLYGNQIEFITQDKFQVMLLANPNNMLDLSNNPIFCSEKMKWLKDDWMTFMPKVLGAMCVNDPGHSIWDSSLIP